MTPDDESQACSRCVEVERAGGAITLRFGTADSAGCC